MISLELGQGRGIRAKTRRLGVSHGHSQWFVELVEDLGHEIWIGDAAQIRASYVRKQKTGKRDAAGMV